MEGRRSYHIPKVMHPTDLLSTCFPLLFHLKNLTKIVSALGLPGASLMGLPSETDG